MTAVMTLLTHDKKKHRLPDYLNMVRVHASSHENQPDELSSTSTSTSTCPSPHLHHHSPPPNPKRKDGPRFVDQPLVTQRASPSPCRSLEQSSNMDLRHATSEQSAPHEKKRLLRIPRFPSASRSHTGLCGANSTPVAHHTHIHSEGVLRPKAVGGKGVAALRCVADARWHARGSNAGEKRERDVRCARRTV